MDSVYVSRGGTKLKEALDRFKIEVKDYVVLDVGSSTGGFVDCLLKEGASKVYSLDTAYGELAWKLRQDKRVVLLERTNILHLDKLPEQVDLVTIDVTFTSLVKILPIIKKFLKDNGKVVALVKPQYEDQEAALKNKGISPVELHDEILKKVIDSATNLGFANSGLIDSPILGGAGNKEYLLYLNNK